MPCSSRTSAASIGSSSRAGPVLAELPAVRIRRRLPRHVEDHQRQQQEHQPEHQRWATVDPGFKLVELRADVGGRHVGAAVSADVQHPLTGSAPHAPGRRYDVGRQHASASNIQNSATSRTTSTSRSSMFDEKLSASAGVRADRASADGSRKTFYAFPKYSASYRFVKPLSRFTNKIDEIKFRGGIGQSGNRPNYGFRDVTISSGALIGGQGSLVAGNASATPGSSRRHERDGNRHRCLLPRPRIGVEARHYERIIKDLLSTIRFAPSSGLTQQQINGGQMSTRGFEGSLTLALISTRDMEWTFRTTFQHNVQYIDKLPVPAFNAPGGSFGASYGRNYIVRARGPRTSGATRSTAASTRHGRRRPARCRCSLPSEELRRTRPSIRAPAAPPATRSSPTPIRSADAVPQHVPLEVTGRSRRWSTGASAATRRT